MIIRKPAMSGAMGAVAVAMISGHAQAQTTIPMTISMSISSVASAAATTQMDFGNIAANPAGGSVILTPAAGVATASVTGGGMVGTSAGTAGDITVTRTASVRATLAAPASVAMTCSATLVTISGFSQVFNETAGAACSTAGTTACSFNIGATATLPASTPSGACTNATVAMTMTYGP